MLILMLLPLAELQLPTIQAGQWYYLEKKNILARIDKYINIPWTILGYFPLISSLMYVRGVQYFWRATFPWRPWKSVAILKTLISWSARRYWYPYNPGFLTCTNMPKGHFCCGTLLFLKYIVYSIYCWRSMAHFGHYMMFWDPSKAEPDTGKISIILQFLVKLCHYFVRLHIYLNVHRSILTCKTLTFCFLILHDKNVPWPCFPLH